MKRTLSAILVLLVVAAGVVGLGWLVQQRAVALYEEHGRRCLPQGRRQPPRVDWTPSGQRLRVQFGQRSDVTFLCSQEQKSRTDQDQDDKERQVLTQDLDYSLAHDVLAVPFVRDQPA